MDNRNAHYRTSAIAIALAALLIAGIFAALPLANRSASAQTAVSITTSADSHGNKFFGPAMLEVRIQDPTLADDNNPSTNVPITVTAFGATQSINANETSGTSGTLLLYVHVHKSGGQTSPATPATPLSGTYINLVIGTDDSAFNVASPAKKTVIAVSDTNVNEGGTISFTYGGISKTITYDDTPVQVTLDRTTVGGSGSAKLYVKAYDPDMNLDPTAMNTFLDNTNTVFITGTDAAIKQWNETGTNSAIFEAVLTVTAVTSGDTAGRSLTVKDFAEWKTDSTVPKVINSTNTVVGTTSVSYVASKTRGTIQSLGTINYSSELPVIVNDLDRNLDSKLQENAGARLKIEYNSTSNTFTMREQSLNSNNIVPAYGNDQLKLTFKGTTNVGSGILVVRPGEDITVKYNDESFSADTSSITFKLTNTAPKLSADKTTVGKASSVMLKLEDAELNDDKDVIESYTVTFTSDGTQDTVATGPTGFPANFQPFTLEITKNGASINLNSQFTVTFIETGANTGVFNAEVKFDDLGTAAGTAFKDGDNVKFKVTDTLEKKAILPDSSVTVNVGIEKPSMSVDRQTVPVPRASSADTDSNVRDTGAVTGISNLGPSIVYLTINDHNQNNSTLIEDTLQSTNTFTGTIASGVITVNLASSRIVLTITPASGTSFTDATNIITISDPIKETGLDTNVFTGTIEVNANNQDKPAWIGAKMKIEYKGLSLSDNTDDATPVTVTFTARQANLSTDTSVVVNGGSLIVTVRDDDANRDTDEEEQIKVRFEWTQNPSGTPDEYLTLDETGPNTGVFTATIAIGDDTIDTTTFTPKPDNDVTVTYYDLTPNVVPTTTWPAVPDSDTEHELTLTTASASGALDIGTTAKVGPSTKLDIVVIDSDENINPNSKDTINDKVTVATDRGVSAKMDVLETESSSSKFSGTLKLVPAKLITAPSTYDLTTTGAGSDELTIPVLPGDVVSVRYEDANNEDGRRTTISKSFEVVSTDPDMKTDKNTYSAGEQITITLADVDADQDPESNDIINVRVTSTSDAVGLSNVQLIETGPNTAVFTGTVTLTKEFSSGSLTVKNGDSIEIKYTDKFPEDYKRRLDEGTATQKDFIVRAVVGSEGTTRTTTPSKPELRDSQNRPVTQVLAGQQVVLASTIKNNEAASTPYAAIVEVRDSNDITVFLNWQTGTLTADGSTGIGLSWTPDSPGTYTARVYVLSNLANPQVLSPTVTSTITVN